MKTYVKAKNACEIKDNFKSGLKFKNVLTHSLMMKIKGGDGEANNGGDIIIIPKK